MADNILLWFRADLRLHDHAGVRAALDSGRPIIPLYIHDEGFAERPLGAASRWWLDRSLRSLSASLDKVGSRLIIQTGNTVDVLSDIIEKYRVNTIISSKTFEPKCEVFDRALPDRFNIKSHRFNTHLLADPADIRTGSDTPYKVFTPFYRALQSRGYTDGHSLPLPCKPWPAPDGWPASLAVDALEFGQTLTPSGKDWSEGFNIWTPGEDGALKRLEHFIAHGLRDYADGRDRPDLDLTSHLSPHLRFGEVSPHRILHEIAHAAEQDGALRAGAEKFRAELSWRDFNYGILQQQPDLHRKNFKPQFDAMDWRDDPKAFRAWCRGETGYSLVDAGMRELWRTGIMHNRVRMICASFLVKHLLIDWRKGEQWFWDTLLDADPANNPANWQWVAGSGADASPFFRIFNPLTQAEKFDPRGEYRRQYISGFTEVKSTQNKDSGRKFERELFDFLGQRPNDQAYEDRIVDHDLARQRALEAYDRLRKD